MVGVKTIGTNHKLTETEHRHRLMRLAIGMPASRMVR